MLGNTEPLRHACRPRGGHARVTRGALALIAGLTAGQACAWPQPTPPAKPATEDTTAIVPVSGMRRLSAVEYDNVVRDLLDDHARAGSLLLPADARTPFDNDIDEQVASPALIEAAELLAREAAARLAADPARRDRIVGCAAETSGCFAEFVAQFGRRALRGAWNDEEADAFLTLEDTYLFDDAVEVAVSAFLQHPRFLYRAEVGLPLGDGIFQLHGWEVATRLAFTLWGTMPDGILLDAADDGELDSGDGIREQAERMLADPRALSHLDRFFAMWLGTESLPHAPELASAMRLETSALIDLVMFDETRPWRDVFTSKETFVTPELAAHYDFPPIASAGWATDPRGERAGLLSHGTFLSVGAKFGDTSPTMRGLAVRERLLCDTVGTPPPGVSVDDPIPPTVEAVCKEDRYRDAHATGGCAGCHARIDPIGFGLERYDAAGQYRTQEPDEPSCEISGRGEVAELGVFEGPGELGALIADSPSLGPCVAQQLVQHALGRSVLDETDRELVAAVAQAAEPPEALWTDVVLSLVTHPAFRQRREEGTR